jgi:hypothetical protein
MLMIHVQSLHSYNLPGKEVYMTNRIERVDELPIIFAMLKKLRVQEIIDNHFSPHGNWKGLSYGQLAVLFITYVLHSLTH